MRRTIHALHQHHSHRYKLMNASWSKTSVVRMFTGIAENLEIARIMRVGDQKQKYDLEGPNDSEMEKGDQRTRYLATLLSLLQACTVRLSSKHTRVLQN